MNAKVLLAIVLVLTLTASIGHSQSNGFARLGSSAQGFKIPERGRSLSFPSDHGAHPDYRIEWWYVTANLEGEDGARYGAQWTLFRSALAPGVASGFADPQIWIGHAAVTTKSRQYIAERLSRGGVGQANVATNPFEAWIDDWTMKSFARAGADELDELLLRANGRDFRYSLTLRSKGPLVLQGDRGYSLKSASGQASYYYSQPFYQASGVIKVEGVEVVVSGQAWLDREWSSQPLASNQTGWDWFSLHFDNGEKLMLFRLRDNKDGFISANWIADDGKTTLISQNDIHLEPVRQAAVAGRTLPVAWRIQIPAYSLDITTRPLFDQAWMATKTPYWEGPIGFSGTATGVGYLEMTGY
ncbi:lipocalin-like domain-containing protein [Pararhizobium arenae]|uniref:lipocalin-like domain-containing protein n=1 Tax=Pararhizobium arenae TaxID=1856850 RepID=UPI00094B4AEA|nr:lipocalin-like domain-containing protein [Pararhizobium arenae]